MQQSGTLSGPSRLRVWVLAARLPTLPAAITPVLVGTAAGVADASFRLLPFLAALVASLLIQIGTNFANDLFDFHKGADTHERLGPLRATQAGLVTPEQMKRATILTFAAATLVGLYLVIVGGWPILLIGLCSIIFGVAYTGGPFPLAYHGLGDLFVFLFFGLVAVNGSAYLQSGTFDLLSLAVSVPVGLLITNVLVINNLRDIETDRVANKRTLAVRIGAVASRWQYALFMLMSYLVPLLLWLTGQTGAGVLLAWLSLPLAVSLVRLTMSGLAGPPLNQVLKRTGQLHLLYGLFLTLGLLL